MQGKPFSVISKNELEMLVLLREVIINSEENNCVIQG